jgi:hypothetical protein
MSGGYVSNFKYQWLTVMWCLLVGIPNQGKSACISMNTVARGFVTGDQVSLYVETSNKGDERALNVRIEALFPGAPQSSPVIEKMEPNAKADHTFEWKMPEGAKYRQMVVPVFTHYADANLYPFSSVTYALAVAGSPPPEKIAGKTASFSMTDRGALVVQFRSLDDQSHELKLRVVAPKEIAVEPGSLQAQVLASGVVSAEFALKNFSALPGSSYTLLVIAAEQRPDGIVETPLLGNVTLVTRYDQFRSNLNWIAPSAITLLLVIYGALWANQRKARRKAA